MPRGRRSVAESEASKRGLRLGSGEVSPVEGFDGEFGCGKLCKIALGEELVFIFAEREVT